MSLSVCCDFEDAKAVFTARVYESAKYAGAVFDPANLSYDEACEMLEDMNDHNLTSDDHYIFEIPKSPKKGIPYLLSFSGQKNPDITKEQAANFVAKAIRLHQGNRASTKRTWGV